ncbi:hypothetical protein Tco_0909495 [Tanacetum coccineum]|uniref:Uncharacterized protein n=1 Tax=Tanacetum coccineum TaxID=301880 RepID=A0ABQ5CQ45_9ASTR
MRTKEVKTCPSVHFTIYGSLIRIDKHEMGIKGESLNSAAGGNAFWTKCLAMFLKIIESKSKVRQTRAKAVIAKVSTNSSTQAVSSDVAELKDIVRALLLDKKNQASASAPHPAPSKH